MIEYRTGDLLESGADILVNTVNCNGVMGKGIALQFKKKFPNMFVQYKDDCKMGKLEPGGIYVYHDQEQHIINFATKKNWWEPSEYKWIDDGLSNLKWFLDDYGKELSISIPALGCANGGLDWAIVKPMIQDSLGNLPHRLYIYEPHRFNN